MVKENVGIINSGCYFCSFWCYFSLGSENQDFVEIVNQVLKERGLNSDLILEIQELKGKLYKHELKIEHMGREIGDLKLTVENERSQNQELLDLKLKNEQHITGLENGTQSS